MPFVDRRQAGRMLASHLQHLKGEDPVVLGLPRGGVPVAAEVARALGAPLDVYVVRKLGVPGQEELALGAIASGGVQVVEEEVVRLLGIPEPYIEAIARRERSILEDRERRFRSGRGPLNIAGRTVIIVDDGLATGSSMRAAVAALKQAGARRIVVAVPVGPADTCQKLRAEGAEVVCLEMPYPFFAVGVHYFDFEQTTDDEVVELLSGSGAGGSSLENQPSNL